METDTDNNSSFIEQDIKQELACCSCFYENITIQVFEMENEKDRFEKES